MGYAQKVHKEFYRQVRDEDDADDAQVGAHDSFFVCYYWIFNLKSILSLSPVYETRREYASRIL